MYVPTLYCSVVNIHDLLFCYPPPPPDPCSSFECSSHAQCRVFQTGQAYCDPSCSVDNGGCEEDETCQLLATPCAAPPLDRPPSPCPLVVVCTPVTTPTPEVTVPTDEAVTTPKPSEDCSQLRPIKLIALI